MARPKPQPGAFDPGEIPMSQGPVQSVAPAHQQAAQQQGGQTYTEQEVIEHSEIVRLQTRKETVLKMLHEEALQRKEIYLANTLAFIMADYGFITLNENTQQDGEG
jgi:hypothetical protein